MTYKSLKIAHSMAGAERGGAESFFARLIQALAEMPHLSQQAFTRYSPQRLATLQSAGVPVRTFRFGSTLNAFNNWRYRKALKKYNPDIVLTYMNRASGLTPRGDYKLVARLGHYYNLKYYQHADYWIGNTKGICDHIVAGGMPAARVQLIQNFIDESPAKALPREQFDTPSDHPLLIAAGRLHTNKGFDILLRALADIPDAYLWLAGSGPEELSLKSMAVSLGIADRVRFLGWRNDVSSLIATGDIFVCPSRHEGLGSIVLEAWAHGCPIVSTASQGPSELIEHGTTGLLSAIDNTEALRANIAELLCNDTLRRTLADNALNRYHKDFSKKVIVKQYCDLFETISD